MEGKLIRLGTCWFIDRRETCFEAPEVLGVRWRVIEARIPDGNYGPAPELADGADVRYVRGCGFWQLHAHGSYRYLYTEREGTALPPIPIAAPKTKLTTRYSCGRWQKYDRRRGWIAA